MIDTLLAKDLPGVLEKQDKKPIVVLCIADKNNIPFARSMITTLRKFHDWPVMLYTDEIDSDKLPKDVTIKDLTPYLQDKMFFYRATPLLSEPLLDEYECVLKIDADSLILGSLDPILEATDYDVGTVINWNRHDEKFYPLVQGWGIYPAEYFNCGLVAMRSKRFVHTWAVWCFTEQFNRLQFKEQDGLNGIIYFGNWNVRCFDHPVQGQTLGAWFGIIGKMEWSRAFVKDKKIIVPKGEGSTPFPPLDIEVKVAHEGGGAGSKKGNWNIYFSEEAMIRINELLK